MPATALPSSGDKPEAAKSCDASGMAEIHRMFRAGFREAPTLVGNVTDGNAAHAEIVGDHLATLSISLHAHHEGEDTMVWDRLEQRAPTCTDHVERMKLHHAHLLVHLLAMDAALPAWRGSGRGTDAAPVLAALAGVNEALAIHLPDEELNIVPVMEAVLTQKEVDGLSEHGRKSTPKGKTWQQLGAILASQPDGGDEWLHKNLPGPVRLIWRVVGKPRYEASRKALAGAN
jgi:hypothetical protein